MVMSAILKDLRAAFGDVEAAPYTVVVERGGYEERVYPARQWVCTTMAGPSRHDLVTPMFRRLFCYISGRNDPNVRIDMTTPVVTLVEPKRSEGEKNGESKDIKTQHCSSNGTSSPTSPASSSSSTSSSISTPSSPASSSSSPLPVYTMGFLIPASHQETPPPSSDKNIFFEDRPQLVVLCRRFSGYMNDEVVAKELAALHQSIINNGEEEGVDFSRYYVAGYDPPFKLLGRRNEVWVVKKVSENRLNGCNGSEVSLNGVLMKEEQLGDDDMVQLVTENGNDEVMLS
ncbi:heme-binding protein 2-like isoform X2 [Portunus trituberculatus]|nr:heme-binding protein 2-like isoform X2 [Portunus trituberculatus]XP_045106998.1 heme-binding protein 2-like isoform X2 [Portunus trituberculatus]XP_045106999.1 heme-binding protein 2-like isoform X2 [Portunus trituberculatus]